MKTSTIIFSVCCSVFLLIALIPESEGGHALLSLMDNKSLKKKVLKKLSYYYLIAGNRKVYAVPFPLPLPIPILKKLQPIIYKESHAVPVPAPYPVPVYQPYHQESYGGGYEGGYGGGNGMEQMSGGF